MSERPKTEQPTEECVFWKDGCEIMRYAVRGSVYRTCGGTYSPQGCALENPGARKNTISTGRGFSQPLAVTRAFRQPEPQIVPTESARISRFPNSN